MRKNFGQKTWLYPMPVLIVGTYDENGKADAMNAAWGGMYDTNKVVLCLGANHRTTKNIKLKGAFTVSFGDVPNLAACDYVGLASGSDTPDKMERAGFTTEKAEFVDAPIINELPVTLECKLEKFNEDGNVVGEIVNVCADERVLGEDGVIDTGKLRLIVFDWVRKTYIELGSVAGKAFSDGLKLKG